MDSSINDSTGAQDAGGGTEICAPLDAFSVSGTPPAEGDEVEFTVKGTVSRVDGGNAYVEPETVNGSPVMSDSGPAGAADSEPDEASLRQNAQNVDQQQQQQYASGGVARMDHRVDSPATIPELYRPKVPYNKYGGGSDRSRGGAPHGA